MIDKISNNKVQELSYDTNIPKGISVLYLISMLNGKLLDQTNKQQDQAMKKNAAGSLLKNLMKWLGDFKNDNFGEKLLSSVKDFVEKELKSKNSDSKKAYLKQVLAMISNLETLEKQRISYNSQIKDIQNAIKSNTDDMANVKVSGFEKFMSWIIFAPCYKMTQGLIKTEKEKPYLKELQKLSLAQGNVQGDLNTVNSNIQNTFDQNAGSWKSEADKVTQESLSNSQFLSSLFSSITNQTVNKQ